MSTVRLRVPNARGSPDKPAYRSPAYRAAIERIERFARDRNAPILIEGESGTGKTTIARYLHQCSPRAPAPFQSVVLSTLDDALASSEMFGHVAGAYTDARNTRPGQFASAAGGTLFLDEIGKASRVVQQKLLHAVEYGEIRPVGSDRDVRVDVRLVFASNATLSSLVDADQFLPDLFARIGNFRVVLPPLRERRADIPDLISHYLAKRSASCGYQQPPGIDKELMDAMVRASWPANLRQLDATVHRLLIEAEGASVITLTHCTDDLSYLRSSTHRLPLSIQRIDEAIRRAGSVSAAARVLGVDRTTIHRFRRRQ